MPTPTRRKGITTTGVDDIDLWMGGLAEKQQAFGGLLGATFNYVFETQMEDLQNGDRFYYLARTAGLNLLTQLEGNSFAELISRNTDVEGLPADSFSRPDVIFNVDPTSGTSRTRSRMTRRRLTSTSPTSRTRTSSVRPAAASATTAPRTSCSTAGTSTPSHRRRRQDLLERG